MSEVVHKASVKAARTDKAELEKAEVLQGTLLPGGSFALNFSRAMLPRLFAAGFGSSFLVSQWQNATATPAGDRNGRENSFGNGPRFLGYLPPVVATAVLGATYLVSKSKVTSAHQPSEKPVGFEAASALIQKFSPIFEYGVGFLRKKEDGEIAVSLGGPRKKEAGSSNGAGGSPSQGPIAVASSNGDRTSLNSGKRSKVVTMDKRERREGAAPARKSLQNGGSIAIVDPERRFGDEICSLALSFLDEASSAVRKKVISLRERYVTSESPPILREKLVKIIAEVLSDRSRINHRRAEFLPLHAYWFLERLQLQEHMPALSRELIRQLFRRGDAEPMQTFFLWLNHGRGDRLSEYGIKSGSPRSTEPLSDEDIEIASRAISEQIAIRRRSEEFRRTPNDQVFIYLYRLFDPIFELGRAREAIQLSPLRETLQSFFPKYLASELPNLFSAEKQYVFILPTCLSYMELLNVPHNGLGKSILDALQNETKAVLSRPPSATPSTRTELMLGTIYTLLRLENYLALGAMQRQQLQTIASKLLVSPAAADNPVNGFIKSIKEIDSSYGNKIALEAIGDAIARGEYLRAKSLLVTSRLSPKQFATILSRATAKDPPQDASAKQRNALTWLLLKTGVKSEK